MAWSTFLSTVRSSWSKLKERWSPKESDAAELAQLIYRDPMIELWSFPFRPYFDVSTWFALPPFSSSMRLTTQRLQQPGGKWLLLTDGALSLASLQRLVDYLEKACPLASMDSCLAQPSETSSDSGILPAQTCTVPPCPICAAYMHAQENSSAWNWKEY